MALRLMTRMVSLLRQRFFERSRRRQGGALLVCAANVCRSPMAEEVLRANLVRLVGPDRAASDPHLRVASAGTRVARKAEPPDTRALDALRRRGYAPKAGATSRALTAEDFDRFGLLLAMDGEVLATMRSLAPADRLHKLCLMLDHAPGLEGQDVPDPYWGDRQGFEYVLDLCEAAAPGVLKAMHPSLEPPRPGRRGQLSPP